MKGTVTMLPFQLEMLMHALCKLGWLFFGRQHHESLCIGLTGLLVKDQPGSPNTNLRLPRWGITVVAGMYVTCWPGFQV